MKAILCLLLFAALPSLLFGQNPPDILWTRTIPCSQEEDARSIQPLSDGGFIVAGARFTDGFGDFLLMKTDADGNPLWSQTYGGPGDEQAECVRECPDGGYVMTGLSNSWCESLSDFGDFYIVRTDMNGDTLWTRLFDLGVSDEPHHLECTPDGGFILTGDVHDGQSSVWTTLMKLDANGDSLWTRYFGTSGLIYRGNSVKFTSDGGYIIAGAATDPPGNGTNVLVIKTDPAGHEQWRRIFGGDMPDDGYDVVETADGGFAVCGDVYVSTDRYTDVYLVRLSAAGDSLWAYNYGRDTTGQVWGERAVSLVLDSDGGFVISGETCANLPDRAYYELLKVDAHGQLLWRTECTANSDFLTAPDVCKTTDGGYALAGMRWPRPGFGNIFLVRYAGQANSSRTEKASALSFALEQNYPNPFNPATQIAFDLPQASPVNLTVFDLLGQRVAELALGLKQAGHHNTVFDGSALPSGMYYYRLDAGRFTETRKMLLIK